ncbi:MAG: hypothetical protein J6D42_11490 [Clostridia bacterium]|nr:hypothetical protein [Clostridia bacterium]
MKKYFCYGKQNICSDKNACASCVYADGSGGEYIHIPPDSHFLSEYDEEIDLPEILLLYEQKIKELEAQIKTLKEERNKTNE